MDSCRRIIKEKVTHFSEQAPTVCKAAPSQLESAALLLAVGLSPNNSAIINALTSKLAGRYYYTVGLALRKTSHVAIHSPNGLFHGQLSPYNPVFNTLCDD